MSFDNSGEKAIYFVVLTMKEALFAANCSTVLWKNVLLWSWGEPDQNFGNGKNLKNIKIFSKVKKHV